MECLQRKEDEGLACQLQVAATSRGRIQLAVRLVVVLGGEDEGREPQIREDEVGGAVVESVAVEEGEYEGGKPEGEDEGGLRGDDVSLTKERGGMDEGDREDGSLR